ncbi:Thioesterase/thiol ester dehydrase-isomerase [Laetiporus sulphureus 93-53]|uniref:Thioesterase/thiol ester dehydrase-isomerase n=1 Tax=Laetiporus sulphureus 93-53 TaxID=1314785 RepID=A0A165B1T3_9APHY|nr:Thioesterase/thiol ester dehydrase-isomerase [Laetiporus sulphureus 93-53]KZT00070.1 Thioesterase/thiol ester dehydrase-isomerase [Laetiporus sulphureus 93-53]
MFRRLALTSAARRNANIDISLRLSRRTAQRFASTSTGSSSSSSWSSSTIFRYIRTFSTYSSIAALAYSVGSLYPPSVAAFISPRPAPPPLHPEDPNHIAYVASLEDDLQNLPVLADHRTQENSDEWYETRPYLRIPLERRVHSLTGGALHGPGKLAIPPLVRAKKDNSEALVFVHVGRSLCGHEGIVHGGLLATLLDESLGRQALLNLPDKVGVTAYLRLNYRAPTRADQFLVLRTRLVEAKGRKSNVAGVIEDMEGTPLVEAEALFIQPKYAKVLDTRRLREMLGEPDDSPVPITEGTVAPAPVPVPGGAPAVVVPA